MMRSLVWSSLWVLAGYRDGWSDVLFCFHGLLRSLVFVHIIDDDDDNVSVCLFGRGHTTVHTYHM